MTYLSVLKELERALPRHRPDPPARPFCEKCQRTVEEFQWETPLEEITCGPHNVRMQRTGEVIITVRCHGEVWAMSNWRGRLA